MTDSNNDSNNELRTEIRRWTGARWESYPEGHVPPDVHPLLDFYAPVLKSQVLKESSPRLATAATR